jgi:hypothetical protein
MDDSYNKWIGLTLITLFLCGFSVMALNSWLESRRYGACVEHHAPKECQP